MFKIGDRVKCIDINTGFYYNQLQLNKIYIVKYIYWDGSISLKDLPYIYSMRLFEYSLSYNRKCKLTEIQNDTNKR